MPRKYDRKRFNDEGLDDLYRATPRDEVRTIGEIAKAAGVERMTIWIMERRALAKIRAEMQRRGVEL